MSVQNLGTVFGPNILRPKVEDPVTIMEGNFKNLFSFVIKCLRVVRSSLSLFLILEWLPDVAILISKQAYHTHIQAAHIQAG